MNNLNIRRVIEANGMSVNRVAHHLFPNNAYPRLALNRVMKGEGKLSLEQISKFASMVGISIDDMLKGNWKAKKSLHTIYLYNDDYEAELDIHVNSTKIFHKKSLIHIVLPYPEGTTLKQYIKTIDEEIIKHLKE